MSIDANKDLIVNFNGLFERSDIDGVADLLTEDCIWWVNAKPHLFPVAGEQTKTEYVSVLRQIHASLESGMKMDVVTMLAEGERVVAQLHAQARTKAGKTYDNQYLMLYSIRDGKIAKAREFTDLLTVNETFY